MKWIKSVGKFVARQSRTKTGKWAAVAIAATVAPHVPGVGEYLPDAVDAALSGAPTLQIISAVGLAFLRDKEAKKEQRATEQRRRRQNH